MSFGVDTKVGTGSSFTRDDNAVYGDTIVVIIERED